MEDQSIVYTAQELLAMVQGPALLQVMESPEDLRTSIDCLERATDLLASIERCRYPGQSSRTHSKAKRSATTPVTSAPVPQNPTEQLRTRILSLVERWWEEKGRGATMREIRNPNRTVSPDDVTEMVSILVHEGLLTAIPVKRTIQYAPSGMVAAKAKEPYKPKKYFQIRGQEVGAYCFARMFSLNKNPAILINGDEDLAAFYKDEGDRLMDVPRNVIVYWETKEYDEVDDYIDGTNFPILPPCRKGYLPDPPTEES